MLSTHRSRTYAGNCNADKRWNCSFTIKGQKQTLKNRKTLTLKFNVYVAQICWDALTCVLISMWALWPSNFTLPYKPWRMSCTCALGDVDQSVEEALFVSSKTGNKPEIFIKRRLEREIMTPIQEWKGKTTATHTNIEELKKSNLEQ